MKPERRRISRRRPRGIAYIEFEEGGSGVILNASEEGLAFQAAGNVPEAAPLRFCIAPNPVDRIALTGEIVWLDRKKKLGGLRFTGVTKDCREKLSAWLGPASLTAPIRETPPEQEKPAAAAWGARRSAVPAPRPTKRAARERERPVLVTQTAGISLDPVPRPTKPPSEQEKPVPVTQPARPSLDPLPKGANLPFREPRFAVPPPRRRYGLWIAYLLCVLVAVALTLSPNLRAAAGRSLRAIASKIARRVHRGNTPAPASMVPVPSQSSPKGFVAAPRREESRPPQTPEKASASAPSQTRDVRESAGTSTTPPPALQPPPNRSEGAPFELDPSIVAQRLWSAVGQGDTTAEVALAQLYLRGDGVPRDCDRARLLLGAAAKQGSKEAVVALKNLKRMGCR